MLLKAWRAEVQCAAPPGFLGTLALQNPLAAGLCDEVQPCLRESISPPVSHRLTRCAAPHSRPACCRAVRRGAAVPAGPHLFLRRHLPHRLCERPGQGDGCVGGLGAAATHGVGKKGSRGLNSACWGRPHNGKSQSHARACPGSRRRDLPSRLRARLPLPAPPTSPVLPAPAVPAVPAVPSAGGYCEVDPPTCGPKVGCRILSPDPPYFTNATGVAFAFSAFRSPRKLPGRLACCSYEGAAVTGVVWKQAATPACHGRPVRPRSPVHAPEPTLPCLIDPPYPTPPHPTPPPHTHRQLAAARCGTAGPSAPRGGVATCWTGCPLRAGKPRRS